MGFACWINKAADTHSENLIFIVYPRKQWLRERSLILGYTHTASLVYFFSLSLIHDTTQSLETN